MLDPLNAETKTLTLIGKSFERHWQLIRERMTNNPEITQFEDLLRVVWSWPASRPVPAALLTPARLVLRPSLLRREKLTYFFRPLETAQARGLMIEFLLVCEVSDAEAQVFAAIVAPSGDQFRKDIEALLDRITQLTYALPESQRNADGFRRQALALLARVTRLALERKHRSP